MVAEEVLKTHKSRMDHQQVGNKMIKLLWKYKYHYLFLTPAILWVFLFRYVPMYGLLYAFCETKFTAKGMSPGEWVGLKFFQQLYTSPMFFTALCNTIVISLLKLISGFVCPIALAIFLCEIRNQTYRRTLQTAVYMPRFVSWVVYGGLVAIFLSPETGMINTLLEALGFKPIYFLADPRYFKLIVILTDILKESGWAAVVYIASIAGVDTQLYESAMIDGANRFQRVASITLPSITPTIVVMLILRLGSILSAGFEQIFNLYNPSVMQVGDILDTYIYRIGLQESNFNIATAAGLFMNTIGFLLAMTTNYLTRKLNDSGIM